jgi:RNA polymerase sigma-70 factor (ECF subfamily)
LQEKFPSKGEIKMNWNEMDFHKIHETFRPKILRYLTRMVDEQEAEDLTQEVFVKISRALETFRGECQLSTWIYRIATNAALDKLGSPSFQRVIQARLSRDSIGSDDAESDEAEIVDQDVWTGEKIPSLESTIMREEMNECVRNRLANLPADYRAVLVLSDMEELPNSEVAKIIGVSVDTVKIRLHRARARLKKDIMTLCPPEEWVPEEWP